MSKPSATRWSAVAVVSTSGACEAARAMKGKRFLGAEAPRLPLKDCTSPAGCRCTYRKYADRRAGPRREEDQTGMRRSGLAQQERRVRRGRRSTDE
jgi:hypothetical protein